MRKHFTRYHHDQNRQRIFSIVDIFWNGIAKGNHNDCIFISMSSAGPLDWLLEQGDEQLISIIQDNVNQTPDLAMAQQRITQTSSLALQRRSGFLPSLGLRLQAI